MVPFRDLYLEFTYFVKKSEERIYEIENLYCDLSVTFVKKLFSILKFYFLSTRPKKICFPLLKLDVSVTVNLGLSTPN